MLVSASISYNCNAAKIKCMKKILILIFLLKITFCLSAQITFKAEAPKLAEVGEMIGLKFVVNAEASGFRAPKFDRSLKVISGPNRSQSQSMSIINGRTSKSYENSYNYTLLPQKEGKFTIPAAQVTVKGKTYRSKPIVIEIVKSSGNGVNEDGSSGTSGEIFLRMNLNKTNIYYGEHLVAELKIYVRGTRLTDLGPASPTYNGFWHTELPTPNRIQLHREKLNGKIYKSGLLRRELLIPVNSGKLSIPEVELEVMLREKIGTRRNFFGQIVDVYDNLKKTIKSPARTITVKPLPSGKPASFSGLVGKDFKLEAALSETEIETGEGSMLEIKLSGTGNIGLFNPENPEFPPGLEDYPPDTLQNISNTSGGTSGTKIFKIYLLANKPGNYNLDPVEISYFDLESETYKTLKTNEMLLEVKKGENYVPGSRQTAGGTVKNRNTDIRYIKSGGNFTEKGNYFAGSSLFYSLYGIAFLLFLIPVIIKRKRIKENADIAKTRNRKAAKISKKRLKKAAVHLKRNNKTEFYKEMLNALWGYISNKLTIPTSELTKERVKREISEQELAEKTVQILDTCEYAQYAPVSEDEQPEAIYERAVRLIGEFEKYAAARKS